MISGIIGIVQARMGSQRAPGKSFARIGGLPVVEIVCRRALQSKRLHQVMLATSVRAEDGVLAEHIARCGVAVFRGSEMDVVARYRAAAREVGATHVVRICADNVFVDWNEIDRLVAWGLNEESDFVGFCNPVYPDRPNDFGGELMTAPALERTFLEATDAFDREHVSPYFWAHPDRFRLGSLEVDERLRTPVKLDLDYPEDLRLLQAIGGRVTDVVDVPAAEVVRVAESIMASRVD